MRIASAVALALTLAACTEPTPEPEGELVGAIISGREQSVKAGASQLPEPVVNQVVRMKSGALLLRANTNGTVVNGSPVPGAVVCVYDQDKDLVPFSRCTNTDALGKATFFFTPPTRAGDYVARINGSVTTNGVVEATTFDTVKATVSAGAIDSTMDSQTRFGIHGPWPSPFFVPKNSVVDKYGNDLWPFRLPGDARITPLDTTWGADNSRRFTFNAAASDTALYSMDLTDRDGAPVARLWYRIRHEGQPVIRLRVCGFKLTCTVP